ncbi:MAG TPA: hypothetical protein PK954_01805, partial [Anaerolineales bacterium]|nr:hypothetical protein [Anaerolineales bacterium]
VLALIGSQIGYRLGYAARGERGPRSGWVSLAALMATLFGLLLTLVIGLPPLLTFCGGPFVVTVLVAAIPVRQPVAETVEEAIGVPQTVI